MDKQVIIYSTPTCVHCQEAKRFLEEKGVNYTEFDVGEDMDKRQEMLDKAGRLTVPVIDVDREVMIGFDENKLSELLGL